MKMPAVIEDEEGSDTNKGSFAASRDEVSGSSHSAQSLVRR